MRWLAVLLALTLASAPAQAGAGAQARFDAAVDRAKTFMLTAPETAADEARRAEPLAKALPGRQAQRAGLAATAWLQGEAHFRLDDLVGAAPLIDKAFALSQQAAPGSKLQADVLLTRGSINAKQLKVAAALADFQEAHRLFSRHRDARREAISLICMANLYFDAKDYETALRYLNEALQAHHADPGLALAIHNTRGVVLQDQNRLAAAAAAFREALRHARALKSTAMEGVFLRNLARNQLLAGQVGQAERSIDVARRASSGTPEDRTQLDILTAQTLLQRGRPAEAGKLVDRALAGLDTTTTDGRFRYAHLTAVSAYRTLGRPDKALGHLEALKRLDDQAVKLATETSTALMAARFNSANQNAKIERLRDAERLRVARDALQRAETERTLFLIGGGATAVVIILLLIGLVTIRRSRDRERAAKDDLAVTNGALGKALAAKTEFLATTSHEIRTPLNGILGMTQVMLADRTMAAPMRDRLTVVHGAGMTMRALVDDILDVAKMETGNLWLERAPFDLPACVGEATTMWAEQARDKGLAFAVDLSRCPARVEGDMARVRQILFNLLSNAVKFTGSGSIKLTVEASDLGVCLTVVDTGVGIDPDKQGEIFESFRQADTSTTRRFGGTGLGLSICRSLAQAMDGAIALTSRPGEGSTFTVDLPLPTLAAETAPVTTACPTLLIVDRNPITRAMLRTLFARHVGSVVFAGTIDEAEERLASHDVCQLLIDDATARAEGEAGAFLSRLIVAAGGKPVTLLWPVAAEQERAELLALGLARVVGKPVTGTALVQALFPVGSQQADAIPLVSQAA